MGIEEQSAAEFAAGYDDQPTETPVAEVAAAEPTPEPTAAPAAEPTLHDVLARLDEITQREAKTQQSHDKLAGHIGRLERSYREIQTNLATGQAAAKSMDDAPSQGAIKAAVEDPEQWATLKKDFPEWAAATEAMVEARSQRFDAEAFEAKVNASIEGKTAEMQGKIVDASLNAVFPGWRKDVASPEFAKWMEAQPADIQQLSASADVGDAATMLSLYRASKAAPAAAPAPAKKPDTSAREKRLAAAVTPRGSGGHAAGNTELDDFTAGYAAG